MGAIYGMPGSGKSRLLGTAARKYPGRVLFIHPPTDHHESLARADRAKCDFMTVRNWNDMNEMNEFLRQEGGEHYDLVNFDSFSLFQDHGLDDIWADVLAEKPHRAKYGRDKAEYGTNMTRLGVWLRDVVGVDTFNFVWTAHPALMDVLGRDLLMPYIQGKNMAEKFCGYCQFVAYLDVVGQTDPNTKEKRQVRVLRTSESDEFYAKDQFDAFDKGRLVNPTMPVLIEALEAARGVPFGQKPKAKVTTRRRQPRRTTTTQ